MELVTDKTIVEVGKFYNVRCAVMSDNDTIAKEFTYLMPVIGEPHNDNQFGFPDKHIHVDARFANKWQCDRVSIGEDGFTNTVCSYSPTNAVFTVKEIVIKKLKCRRLNTGIRPPFEKSQDRYGSTYKPLWHNWVRTMIGKSCAGKKCPHLGTAMIEKNGVLVCPLHDLHGDIETEKIIAHPKCL